MREAACGFYAAEEAADWLRDAFVRAMAKPRTGSDRVLSATEASSEFSSILAWAVGQVDDVDLDEVRRDVLGRTQRKESGPKEGRQSHDAPEDEGRIQKAPVLRAEFWDEHPVLGHVRDAAYSREVAPVALLACCLGRVAAYVPPSLHLPPIIGSKVPLCFLAANVAETGIGKGAASKVSAELMTHRGSLPDSMPIGSGEGLYEAMFDWVEEPSTNGKKPNKDRKQVHHNAFFYIDEGEVLVAIAARSGSTLLPNLRSIFTGGPLGNTNASKDRKRFLDVGSYAYGIVIGTQATMAGNLLSDDQIAAGTPGRIFWAPLIDPTIPDRKDRPDWPGPLDWKPPTPKELMPLAQSMPWADDFEFNDQAKMNARFHVIRVAESIWDEISANHLARIRGEVEGDNLKGHALLVRVKIAALLCILCGFIEVTEQWWGLAGMLMEINDQTLAWVQGQLRTRAAHRERTESARYAGRQVQAKAAEEGWRVKECAKRIYRMVKDERGISRRTCTPTSNDGETSSRTP